MGRVLGVGARVAAKTIREKTAQVGQAGGSGSREAAAGAAARVAGTAAGAAATAARRAAGDSGRRMARGAGRFTGAMLQPVAKASGVLALEIFGVFFALFAIFFLGHAWMTLRGAGWHDRHAAVYTGLGLVFAWFTASSFWKAKKKAS
ncbi:MAG TPA: hypothetical protein VIY53_15565 [Acidobacteriaceae bacterium]